MLFIVAFVFVGILGFLAQSIGLCMVRGINEFRSGKPEFLIAILLSGVLTWVAIVFSSFADMPTNFKTHEVNIWFALGGLLFGTGAALNQGCGVSTLSKLSRGDSKMIFTISGWLIGWSILEFWNPLINYTQLSNSYDITIEVLISLTIALLIWIFLGNKARKKLWLTMMSIGLIGGFVFLFYPKWPPSGLFHKLSNALINTNEAWPSIENYLLFISLLLGMFAAAWRTNKFKILTSNWREWLIHILAGTFMGIGASLALGGNDTQLLLALPTFSPAGGVTIIGMLIGIWAGLYVNSKLNQPCLTHEHSC